MASEILPRSASAGGRESYADQQYAPVVTLLVLVLCVGAQLAAQDRVLLFESYVRGPSGQMLPGEIREVDVTSGGRGWSVVRSVALPPHYGRTPVALADGRHVVWLAADRDQSTLLVQYDAIAARAAIVDVGRFDRQAFLLSDKSVPRVFVIEPTRVTFIDARLQPSFVDFAGPKQFSAGHVADRYLVLHRANTGLSPDAEAIVVDTQTAAVTRVVPLGEFSTLRISRDGQRLYRAYSVSGGEARIDIIAVATGEVVARAVGPRPSYVFELDDRRGVVAYDDSVAGRVGIFVRDAATLAFVGEFAPGVFDRRRNFRLQQTAPEAAILMYSLEFGPGYFDCDNLGPRIDVFDGRTYELTNRIDAQGRCPVVVALPSR